MKRIYCTLLGIAMVLPVGCSSSGTGSTAPGTNAEKPGAVRKLTVKSPGDKSIKQNGTVDADISVTRDHFSGPVDIEFHGLPAGISVITQDLTIPAGKDSVKVTLRAAPEAKVVSEMVHIAAKAKDQKDMKEDTVEFKLDVKAKE